MSQILYMTLSTQGINVTQPGYVALHPSSVIFGFAGALEFQLNRQFSNGNNIEFNGISIILREFNVSPGLRSGAGMRPTTPAECDIHATRSKSPPIVRASADFDVAIIIDIAETDPHKLIEFINNCLRRMKIMGGDITSFEVELFDTEKQLKNAISAKNKDSSFGWLYVLRDDLVKKYIEKYSPAETLIRITQPLKKNDKGKFQRSEKGWLFPAVIGYQMLESPKKRTGA